MIEKYRAILRLLIQQRSYRDIKARLGVGFRTISHAKAVLDDTPLATVDEVDELSTTQLEEWFVDRRRTTGNDQFVPIDMDAVLAARTSVKKPSLRMLWTKYVNDPDPAPGQKHYCYERFCQLVNA